MARLDGRVPTALLLVAALTAHISLQNLAQADRVEAEKADAGKAIDAKDANQKVVAELEAKQEKFAEATSAKVAAELEAKEETQADVTLAEDVAKVAAELEEGGARPQSKLKKRLSTLKKHGFCYNWCVQCNPDPDQPRKKMFIERKLSYAAVSLAAGALVGGGAGAAALGVTMGSGAPVVAVGLGYVIGHPSGKLFDTRACPRITIDDGSGTRSKPSKELVHKLRKAYTYQDGSMEIDLPKTLFFGKSMTQLEDSLSEVSETEFKNARRMAKLRVAMRDTKMCGTAGVESIKMCPTAASLTDEQ